MKAANPKALRRMGRLPATHRRVSNRTAEGGLTRLKGRLLRQLLAETENPRLQVGLRRAAAEAESLAWLTPVPLLVLPALLEEKAREARLYATRQAELRESSREWLSLSE